MNRADERHIIEQIKQGQKDAFKALVERYKQPLYHYCYRLCRNQADAEDLSQEVFIKVYQKINQFREEAKMCTWIYRIAGNAFIDKKRKKVHSLVETDNPKNNSNYDTTVRESQTEQISPERQTESAIMQKHINNAMRKLSVKEKEAFILKHYNGLRIKEIALIFNTSEGTVKSHLFRAVQKLQGALSFYKRDLGLEES